MRTTGIKVLAAVAFFCCVFCPGVSARSAGTTSSEFLMLSAGARASALGEAFTGLANDSTAIFWNPAGITSVNWKEIVATYNSLIQETSVGSLCFAMPLGKTGNIGVGVTYFNSGSLTGRDATGAETGSYSTGDTAFSLSYGVELAKDFSMGVTAKYISEKIDNESGSGIAGDIGGLYGTKFLEDIPVSIGVSVSNLGGSMGPAGKSPLPIVARAGVSAKLFKENLILLAGADVPKDSDITAGVGAEYYVNDMFTLRIGYKLLRKDLKGIEPLTAGFGILHTLNQDFMLDYAISSLGDLGLSHKVSFGVRF
jgi:hypothetical protein